MSLLDEMSQDDLGIYDILNTIDNLYQPGQEESDAESLSEGILPFTYTEEEMEKRGFAEGQIQEVLLGIAQQLPVAQYAQPCYNWMQMRQIRLGLLENLDTSIYENPLYSAEQMHEIRLGLIDHLDVSTYAKLIYTATDMNSRRRNLLASEYQVNPNGFGRKETDEDTDIQIRISDNCMEAYITIPREQKFPAHQIKKILMRHEIVHGILEDTIQEMAKEKSSGEEILIAKGTPSKDGRNGRYVYFFNRLLPERPKTDAQGNVDYTTVVVADKVNPGDVLAQYHPGTAGKTGTTVTGIPLEGQQGRELPPLSGSGFIRDSQKNIYTATTDGFVSLDEVQYNLNVWNIFVVNGNVNRYNGNISYDGTIHIQGAVSDMAVISASGDIVIDGFTEGAQLTAGGNIILKSGINANERGFIHAGGKVMGSFFENADIIAKGNVEGEYFLNCNVKTDNSLVACGGKARIMGGRIQTGKSVESLLIGNYGGSETYIDVGDFSWIDQNTNKIRQALDKVENELSQLEKGREKLRNLFGADITKNNDLYRTTCLAIQTKEGQQTTLERELDYYLHLRKAAANAYIKASGGIQEDVLLSINGFRKKLKEPVTRGVTLTQKHLR